jgi:hypothetical protein
MLLSLRYRVIWGVLRVLIRCGLDQRELERAVLRHQLKVLGRGGRRPGFTTADRAFLAAAARLLSRDPWRSLLVRPDTLLRWHRQLSRRRQRRSSRPGRPPLDPSTKHLILRLGRENPRWGLPPDQGRASETRHRRLGHDHRHGASPRWPRSRATDRPDLDTVSEDAGLRPVLRRLPVRGGKTA